MSDFSNYNLSEIAQSERGVYELAGGLLPEIAEATGYELRAAPTSEALQGFIGHIGPAKTLQDNIGLAQERIGRGDDATTVAADWVERSGVLTPVSRPFKDNSEMVVESERTVVMTGGVANWILRRCALIERLDPKEFGRVTIGVGNRRMGGGEHRLVASYGIKFGAIPTETQFVDRYVAPRLNDAGFNVKLVRAQTAKGDEVLDTMFECWVDGSLQDRSILVVGNAPSYVQSAAQVRAAAQRVAPAFDRESNQLFMISDTIPLARRGESTATHQNPLTALGQIARNGLFLHQASQSI